MDSETHAQIIEILDLTNDMTIATVRPDGFPQATVVSFVHDDLRIYFGTSPTAQKALNIASNDRVSLTVTRPYANWGEIEGLSIGGHARLVMDGAELARVAELMFDRFPQVADYVPGDPADLAVFRIDPVVVSILDYAKGFGHTEAFEVQGLISA